MGELAANDLGIAVDIRSDLHDRCFSISTRERHQVGSWHDGGDDDRLPFEVQVAQQGSNFLGKKARWIMVQYWCGQESLPINLGPRYYYREIVETGGLGRVADVGQNLLANDIECLILILDPLDTLSEDVPNTGNLFKC